MIKDYDLEIHYHPGKANVVADALSRKASCSCISATALHATLCREMENLNLAIVSEGTIANVTLIPTLQDQIIAVQKSDVGMSKIRQSSVTMILKLNVSNRTVRVFFGLRID